MSLGKFCVQYKWIIQLIHDQGSLQALHVQLVTEPTLTANLSSEQLNPPFQRASHQADQPAKRLCLPGLATSLTNVSLIHVLAEKISAVIESDCGKTVAAMRTTVQ